MPDLREAVLGAKRGVRVINPSAQARARGDATVTLLVATNLGSTGAVSAALAGLGGNVRYQDDQLGYIRVLIDTARAETAAALTGVQAVDLDEVIPIDDPRPEAVDDVAQVDPPGARRRR